MGKPIVDDELWAPIEPLLPPAKPRRFRYPGRMPVLDRAALTGILFVLRSGVRWNELPSEMGCGSGVSCWRRLRDWQSAGGWGRLHEILLAKIACGRSYPFLARHHRLLFSSWVGAGQKTGPNPTDRARPGSKHHVATDANSTPIAVILTGANRNDITQHSNFCPSSKRFPLSGDAEVAPA